MRRVLFLGAHCDDIELGCGATITKHRDRDWEIHAVVFSHVNPNIVSHVEETRKNLLSCAVMFENFKTRRFADDRDQIWRACRRYGDAIKPEIVFVTAPDGTHQDHDVLGQEAMRKSFTGASIIYYSPGPGNMLPNYFETVSGLHAAHKLSLLSQYADYQDKPYFQADYVMARMLDAGIHAGCKYAEPFTIARLVNGL